MREVISSKGSEISFKSDPKAKSPENCCSIFSGIVLESIFLIFRSKS